MQTKIVEARLKGVSEETLKPSIERVDKLISFYKMFDKYYFAAHFEKQKSLGLQRQIMKLVDKVEAVESENKKLLESLNWKPE